MRVLIFFWGLVLGAIAGCAGGPSGPTGITPVEARVDAIAGRTLVMPVELTGPIDPRDPADARLDDGRRPAAGLFWISVGPDEHPDPRGWLAPAGQWFATPASASSRPSAAGVWAVVVDLPADASGQSLWLHGRHVGLNWIPSPAPFADDSPLAHPLAPFDVLASPRLGQMLLPERESPARRWRWRMVTGALKSDATREDAGAFPDPVLEALAEQTEARWAAAIERLEREDAALAGELVRRLGEMIDFGGTVAPAWPASGADLDNLLGDLLSPGLDAPRRAARVRAWLAAQPAAVAWIQDDAGGRDGPSGASISTIGVANLSRDGALAGVVFDDGSLPSNLTPLKAFTAASLSLPLPIPAPPDHRDQEVERTDLRTPVRVRVGAWEQKTSVTGLRAMVRPPGLRIGPLMSDWTMDQWLAGGRTPAPAEAGAAALLLMRDEAGTAGGWTIFLEARRDPAAAAEDVVRIWLGPTGTPAILRVSSDGFVIDESAPGPQSREPARTPVSRLPDGRWSCKLPVPARCIEADGTLRIGVERVDAAGRRSAWPRPMLPWQSEPGRVAVDTTAWGELGADHAGR